MNDIRIAAVIFNSPINQTRHNLDRMAKWIIAAKKQGATIICFPEMCITGYSPLEDIKDSAETIPGPITRDLLQMSQKDHIAILAGMAEKDKESRLFASHLVVTPDGITSRYRKLHIAPPERNVFSPGNKIPLFEIHGVKFGIQLCYDAHFPELSSRMASEGAEVIFMPHASPRGTPTEKFNSWMRHLPARAFDNSLYIVACNQTGENQKGLNFPGISMIIGPAGKIMKKDISGKEGMIVADLSADDFIKVRSHPMRYFLPNRRPELY